MAGGLVDDDEAITEINVTPLVDVMLVLLVIFMVTATYIVNQSINVELPKAATGEQAQATNLAFVLDKDSKLYLNGAPTLMESLPELIKKEKQGAANSVQALITADEATPHGSVVKLIDVIRKSGITEFAINVEAELQ